MHPYIISLDKSYPIAEIVYEYGKSEYKKGLQIGFLGGVVYTTILVLVINYCKN